MFDNEEKAIKYIQNIIAKSHPNVSIPSEEYLKKHGEFRYIDNDDDHYEELHIVKWN